MAVEVHIYDYRLKDGKTKKYGYRFEVASIGGKRKWLDKRGFKTKGDAIKAGNEALNKYNNTGKIEKPSEISFSDFINNWLERYSSSNLNEVTKSNYEKKIRLYINPVLGQYRIRSITKEYLQDLLNDLKQRGYSKNTIGTVRGILVKCFESAVDLHVIPFSPATKLEIAKKQKPGEIPTREEPHVYIPPNKIEEIFKRFPEGTPNHIALMLGYKCGLRLGEAFALCWDDVDLEKGTLTVNHQVQWHQDNKRTKEDKIKNNGKVDTNNSYWYLTDPKYDSVRTIEIDNELIALLTREKAKQDKARAYYDDLYFHYYVDETMIINQDGRGREIHFVNVRESGEYIQARTMQHTSSIIHHQLNYPEFDYHSLRHTHATMLAEQEAPLKFIQQRLGHKKIDTTLNIYSHLTSKLKDEGKGILNQMFTTSENKE